MNPPIDFLIITPLREELDAVLRKIPAPKLPPSNQDIRTYYGANLPTKFADGTTASYKIVVAPLLGMGHTEAANLTGDAIRRWQPRYVLLVGIAGGYGKAGVDLGDILISEQVVDYELQKLTETGKSTRFKVHEVDPRLLGTAQNVLDDTWIDRVDIKRPRKGGPKIFFGPICTGNKVIANGLLDEYSEIWTKLIGVEMEAGGAASAAYQAASRPGFFMIRGVSDLADKQKDARTVKKWRAYACDVAASFTIALLQQGPIPPITHITRKPTKQFWNASPIDSSRVHERIASMDPTVLIILLHGRDGNPVTTWGNFPKLILESIGADADVISYDNPASELSTNGVADAANRLRRIILNRPHSYMHIFLLAHGDGSLVVRELLTQDVESVMRRNVEVLGELPPITAKVRAVFHFTESLHPTHSPVAGGRTDSLSDTDLKERLQHSLDLLKANDFPRPRLVEFSLDDASSSASIASSLSGHSDLVEVIASQKFARPPSQQSDARIEAVVARMRPYFNSPDMILSYLTMRRFVGLDAGINPTSESGEAVSLQDRFEASDWVGWDGSQQLILERLNKLANPRQVTDHPKILITGSAGVGKSTVLRRHARFAATRYLERNPAAQLCIYIPMQNVTLDRNQLELMPPRGTAVTGWRVISQYMATLINDVLLDPQEETAFADASASRTVQSWQSVCPLLTRTWLESRAVGGLIKVILDGIDEFLVNHSSSLSVQSISQLLQIFEAPSRNNRTQCVLAARNTLPAIAELSSDRDDVYEIRPLSEDTAEALFPGTRDLLQGLAENLRRLLLSPLVLVRLGPRAAQMRKGLLNSRAAILRKALEALIEESELTRIANQVIGSRQRDEWMQALTLAAWALYRDSLGFITETDLKNRIEELKDLWSKGNPVSHRFVDGIAICENDSTFKALRSRTILNSLGKDSLRFTHREWEDFLVSDYLAQCALGQVFSELEYRAFAKQIYIDGAEVLWHEMTKVGMRITNVWLDNALAFDNPFARPYTLMNICALLGNGPVDLDQFAFRELMKLICDPRCPEVTRIVAVSSFGMRMLRDDKRDQSMKYMLGETVDALGEIIRQGSSPNRKVTASMAWCYRAELRRRHSQLRSDRNEPWPTLSAMSASGVSAAGASGIVWKQIDNSISVDDRCRSFQIAAAQYPLAVRGLSYEEISLTHYLFLAAATLRAGAASSEIFPLLRAVFAKESGVAERVERYGLSEVRELFRSCYQAAGENLLVA